MLTGLASSSFYSWRFQITGDLEVVSCTEPLLRLTCPSYDAPSLRPCAAPQPHLHCAYDSLHPVEGLGTLFLVGPAQRADHLIFHVVHHFPCSDSGRVCAFHHFYPWPHLPLAISPLGRPGPAGCKPRPDYPNLRHSGLISHSEIWAVLLHIFYCPRLWPLASGDLLQLTWIYPCPLSAGTFHGTWWARLSRHAFHAFHGTWWARLAPSPPFTGGFAASASAHTLDSATASYSARGPAAALQCFSKLVMDGRYI